MRFLISILFIFVLIKSACAQNRVSIDSFRQIFSPTVEDSLKQLLSASKEDSNQVLILHQLTYPVLFSRPDSAMYFAQEGLKLAQSINYKKGQVLCTADIGAVWWILGDYTKANEVLLKSVKSAEALNDAEALEWSLSFLLSSYRDQGDYSKALKYCFHGAAIHKYFTKKIWNVITGSIYEEMNKTDSALFYLKQGDFSDYNFLMLGHTYAKIGNNILALDFYKKAVSESLKNNNYKDLADGYIGLARLYEKSKPDSSIFYAKKGFDIAQQASFKKWVFETSLFLSRVFEKKDAVEALRYFKLAMAAKDSMFNLQKITLSLSSSYNEQLHQKEDEARRSEYQNRVRTYALLAALSFFLLLAIILLRNNRQKQKAKSKIEKAYSELKNTQAQLIQSEKMASLGELTAGIAHEIQNPLNFVNNFSEVSGELVDEMTLELDKGDVDEAKAIATDIKQNLDKINHHGKRADAIVKGMLQHSRSSTGEKQPTDLNALCDEYLRLTYHGIRAKNKSFNATIETDFDRSIGKIDIIPQDIGRVVLNLINNAFYAVDEKKKQAGADYNPTVTVGTKLLPPSGGLRGACITVSDNGNGIPQNIVDKIFQPFFTTKSTGQGTGLGLSLSYDIVKAHGGGINVETKEGEGSEFIIHLPI